MEKEKYPPLKTSCNYSNQGEGCPEFVIFSSKGLISPVLYDRISGIRLSMTSMENKNGSILFCMRKEKSCREPDQPFTPGFEAVLQAEHPDRPGTRRGAAKESSGLHPMHPEWQGPKSDIECCLAPCQKFKEPVPNFLSSSLRRHHFGNLVTFPLEMQ
jgi:hypothetical protein